MQLFGHLACPEDPLDLRIVQDLDHHRGGGVKLFVTLTEAMETSQAGQGTRFMIRLRTYQFFPNNESNK